MVKQQAIDCIALDGKEDKEAGLNNFTSRPSDDKKTYYVKLVRGQVVGDFYIGVDHLTAEQARMGAQAAVNALNALKNKE
jgi:hypothetical protein